MKLGKKIRLNALARILLSKCEGFEVEAHVDIGKSQNPRAKKYWAIAQEIDEFYDEGKP